MISIGCSSIDNHHLLERIFHPYSDEVGLGAEEYSQANTPVRRDVQES